jgi:hypothetical protein
VLVSEVSEILEGGLLAGLVPGGRIGVVDRRDLIRGVWGEAKVVTILSRL